MNKLNTIFSLCILLSFVACSKKIATKSEVLGNLKASETFALYNIDQINGKANDGSAAIVIEDENLTVKGWAVDPGAKAPAEELWLKVDEQMFPITNFKQNRGDVAQALKQASYAQSGFIVSIPVVHVISANPKISIVVVNRNKNCYYPSKLQSKVSIAIPALMSMIKDRPNVILIVSDDHAAKVMGLSGDPYLATPNLDRMANEGVVYNNAFSVAGTCSPSRASILTGLYPHNAAAPYIVRNNNVFRTQQNYFVEALQAAGYYTAHFGKWHLGEGRKVQKGFDHWAGFEWVGPRFNPTIFINNKPTRHIGFTDDVLADLVKKKLMNMQAKINPSASTLA